LLFLAVSAARADDDFWPYRVEHGDTLIGIRDRLLRPGNDWRELQRVNRVANPRRLVPGSILRIPVALLAKQTLAAEVLHVHGEVDVQRPGRAVQRLAGGESLAVGDVVRTEPQSRRTAPCRWLACPAAAWQRVAHRGHGAPGQHAGQSFAPQAHDLA
jgi:hypothetical protein